MRVGEDPVDLHLVLVHLLDVYPEAFAQGVCGAVRLRCVVVMIRVFLLDDTERSEAV